MKSKSDKREEADILRELSVLEGSPCAECGRLLCGHHALVALVMGFKSAPRCASCLAGALELEYVKFRDQVVALVQHRDCYRSGWTWAGRRENLSDPLEPECLWRRGKSRRPVKKPPKPDSATTSDADWDAGGMGCGDLVLELRLR